MLNTPLEASSRLKYNQVRQIVNKRGNPYHEIFKPLRPKVNNSLTYSQIVNELDRLKNTRSQVIYFQYLYNFKPFRIRHIVVKLNFKLAEVKKIIILKITAKLFFVMQITIITIIINKMKVLKILLN